MTRRIYDVRDRLKRRARHGYQACRGRLDGPGALVGYTLLMLAAGLTVTFLPRLLAALFVKG